MVVKKSNILNTIILLAMTAVCSFATDNSLVRLDLKKTSGNAVDITLFTTEAYADNVIVRKKSDNKYVILIPKVQSSGFHNSDLNAVKDVISNIDVKTVNDTTGGYTKVTLITTKPLDIKTKTQKSHPLTQEQKEYKTLIAEANAIKNNIAKQSIEPPKVSKTPKTEVTIAKAPVPSSVNTKKNEEQVKNSTVKTETKQQIVKSENKPEKMPSEKVEKQVRKDFLSELINDTKVQDVTIPVEIIDEVPEIQNVNPENDRVGIFQKLKNTAAKFPGGKKSVALLIGVLLALKILKSALSKAVRKPFIDELSEHQPVLNTVKHNNIVNDENLNWQEKYKTYLDKTAKPVERADKKGNYILIKQPAEEAVEKIQDLQETVSQMPEINEEIVPEIVEIHNEAETISRSIKLKAFNNKKPSLKMSSRSNNSRFKKYEAPRPMKEQKNIELGDSMLYKNPRISEDANLKISDVEKRIKFKHSDYIMSSVEEFFSILDKEKTVEQIPLNKSQKTSITNPIAKQRSQTKESYLNGLIIKSGFNIDANKGFYVVNNDGKSALIGCVNEEVFVLKKFDGLVSNPVQVRRDNDNVYMVKAGGFKSLVKVDDDKMGVLIEL